MFYYDNADDYRDNMERDVLLSTRGLYGEILLSEDNIYKFMTVLNNTVLMEREEMLWVNQKGEFIHIPVAKAKELCTTAQTVLIKAYQGDATQLKKHIAAAEAARRVINGEPPLSEETE